MEAFVLPCGVTGFRDSAAAALPESDFSEFRSHCYAASRAVGGRVLSFREWEIGRNYAECVIETRNNEVAVLINRHYPVVAFTRPADEGAITRQFVEAEDLETAFADLGGYSVLSRAVAEDRIAPDVCRELSLAELAQVAYWQPETIGQVVFNSWD